MSDNQQTPPPNPMDEAIDAWAQELLRSTLQVDERGNQRTVIPFMQAYADVQLTQLKLEALFEELGAEHFVDPAKVTGRLIEKLERERKVLKQANDARPRVTPVGAAVAAAINGKGRR